MYGFLVASLGQYRYPQRGAIIRSRPEPLRETFVQAYRAVQARSALEPAWIPVSSLNRNFSASDGSASRAYFDSLCGRAIAPQRVVVKQFERVGSEWRVIRECVPPQQTGWAKIPTYYYDR